MAPRAGDEPRPASSATRRSARNPGIAKLLMDLESDDNLRAKLEIATAYKLEIELPSGAGGSEQPQWITSGEGSSQGSWPGISSWPCSIPADREERGMKAWVIVASAFMTALAVPGSAFAAPGDLDA